MDFNQKQATEIWLLHQIDPYQIGYPDLEPTSEENFSDNGVSEELHGARNNS